MGAFEFYDKWTDWEQPLTKFDLVAVPGASEANPGWGLLTFDERRFLFNNVRCLIQPPAP